MSATIAEIEATIAELVEELEALEAEAREIISAGDRVTDDLTTAIGEVSTRLLPELDRWERRAMIDGSTDVKRYDDVRRRVEDAVAMAEGGPIVCRVTGQPLAKLTDYGNAERIAMAHADDLRYAAGLGWHVFDGRRWRHDTDGAATRIAKAIARAIREEVVHIEDAELTKKVYAHAVRSESAPKLRAALELAQSETPLLADPAELDADPMLLNVLNGTLDLRTGRLRDHDPAEMLTKLAPVEFDPAATAPTWGRFLRRALPDDDLRAWIQTVVGYWLTGETSEQAMFILHGPGATGKTTFAETIGALLGDYGAVAGSETFMATRNGTIPNDLARLPGVRFVRASETEEGASLAVQLVKRVTGQDTISARFMRSEFFEFRPAFKLGMLTNNMPRIGDGDGATWRRIRLIPFAVEIPAAEQDRHLLAKLRAEMPGILAWAVEGCLRWQAEGVGEGPSEVTAATLAYRDAEDSVGAFVRDRCTLRDGATSRPAEVDRAYREYCRERRMRSIGGSRELLASPGAPWRHCGEVERIPLVARDRGGTGSRRVGRDGCSR